MERPDNESVGKFRKLPGRFTVNGRKRKTADEGRGHSIPFGAFAVVFFDTTAGNGWLMRR